MKTIIAIALCLGLAMTATLNIPLDTKAVYQRDSNQVNQLVDEVLFATADFVNQTQNADQEVIIDLESNVNYLLSRTTSFNQVAVSPSAFDCTTQCAQGTSQTGPFPVLGGKVLLNGGVQLKNAQTVEVEDSNDETKVSINVYVPDNVDSSTQAQENQIFQQFDGGLSLSRNSNNVVSALNGASKLVNSNIFSVYIHETIAQLNIGGFEEYFVQPGTSALTIPTNNSNVWTVTLTGIKIKAVSQLQSDSQTLTAHFDLTSKYIYIPHVEAVNTISGVIPAFYYFMTTNQLPCFNPASDVSNQYSYICPAGKFPGYDAYQTISFSFRSKTQTDVVITLAPTDYINVLEDGSYELLFRFAAAPQSISDIYFGTTLFEKYYTTFDSDRSTITFRNKYDVAVQPLHLEDSTRIPIIVVGVLLAIIVVAVLVFSILKQLRQPESNNVVNIPMYSQYRQAATPVYQQGFNTSTYQTQVVSSVYPATTNVVVSSQQLRQSQTQVRQSQTIVRNSQQYQARNNQNY